MKKIRWAICDDADFFCYIYKTKLENVEDLEFAGCCMRAADAPSMVKEHMPDVLLLDIQIETVTAGIDVIPALKAAAPNMKIIMLTSYDDENYIYKAFANGADSYLLKDASSVDLIVSTIVTAYENKATVPPKIAQIIAKKAHTVESSMKSLLYVFEIMSTLSKSEYEILKALYNGDSYKDISSKRFVTESTVRNHVTRILKKFNSPSMKKLIADLKEIGIFNYLP